MNDEIIDVIAEEADPADTNAALVVTSYIGTRNPLIDAAKRGLHGELSAASIPMYDQVIEDFLSFAAEHMNEFGGSFSVAFSSYLNNLRDRGYALGSLTSKRVQLRRFFEWGSRVGWISMSIYHEICQIKLPRAHGRRAGNWLTFEQMQALLNAPDITTAIGRRDKAMLALMLGCALRRSEVVRLTWEHLVRYGDTWVIKNMDRKHHRTQDYIPVPAWVIKVLDQYMPYDQRKDMLRVIVSYDKHGNARSNITTDAVWRIVRAYAEKLGLGNITPHDLRRSWAREAKNKGLDISQIQLALGHESVATTEKYINEIMQIASIASAVELEV